MSYTIWTRGISEAELAEKYHGLARVTKVAENQVVNTNGGRYEGTTQWLAEWPDLVPFAIVAQLDDFVVAMSDDLDPEEALEDVGSKQDEEDVQRDLRGPHVEAEEGRGDRVRGTDLLE